MYYLLGECGKSQLFLCDFLCMTQKMSMICLYWQQSIADCWLIGIKLSSKYLMMPQQWSPKYPTVEIILSVLASRCVFKLHARIIDTWKCCDGILLVQKVCFVCYCCESVSPLTSNINNAELIDKLLRQTTVNRRVSFYQPWSNKVGGC